MIAMLPKTATLRAAYIQELEVTVAQLGSITALPTLPWPLLALNATFYLDQYLTTAAYQSALTAALHTAATARQTWSTLPTGDVVANELSQLIAAETSRSALYGWLFDHALTTGNPAQFLLAQHACEIAEVVDEQHLLAALRLGMIAVQESALTAGVPSAQGLVPNPASIEHLSRALLGYRLPARRFAESLLLLHAAQRARQLTGITYAAPVAPPDQTLAPMIHPPTIPKRLRIVQCQDLAQRAMTADDPLAIMTVEAGLVEAEDLRGASQLLLLAALDRATSKLV